MCGNAKKTVKTQSQETKIGYNYAKAHENKLLKPNNKEKRKIFKTLGGDTSHTEDKQLGLTRFLTSRLFSYVDGEMAQPLGTDCSSRGPQLSSQLTPTCYSSPRFDAPALQGYPYL